jgi:UDP-2,3-diacylglucosamine pyrophosphatase LpxH
MEQKRVTLIISDLHMGDGKPGDDFVFDKDQLIKFLRNEADTPEGRKGEIELIINGDFLEFVQVNPQSYELSSKEFWCSEAESLAKLGCILRGHSDVFDALKAFQGSAQNGNRVTLFAGNHDVDLYWCGVQKALREQAGNLNIELKETWYQRYGDRLWISHGHLFPSIDPANGFKHWSEPRLQVRDDSEPKRLEMCPGTLFVVKYVNLLEAQYPFADNLHPEIALAGILWREDAWGLKTVAWMLTRFALRYPKEMLSSDKPLPDIGPQVREAIRYDPAMCAAVGALYRDLLHQPEMTADDVRRTLNTDDALADFVEQLMGSGAPWETWVKVLNRARPSVLSNAAPAGGTLAIRRAGAIDVRKECIAQAERTWRAGAQVVVLGHTHLPQSIEQQAGRYYNPGSWTRYIETDKVDTLTLENLRREVDYPYALHCVRVEDTGADALHSEFFSIDPGSGMRRRTAS